MSPGRRSLVLMSVFAALWAGVELLAGGVLARYSPYQVVWTRYATHIGLMLLVWGWHAPGALWRTQRRAYQFGRSVLMLGMPASWIVAVQHGADPALVMAVFWLSPLLIVALAHLLLGERAPWPVWATSGLACIGANLMFPHRAPATTLGLLLALGMALCFSLYVVMTRSLRTEPVSANLFYTAFGVLLLLTPAMPGLWITPTRHDLMAMIGVGVLGLATLYALDRMAAAAPVSLAAAASGLQLVFLLGGGWATGHLDEGWRSAAAMLILVAVALYLWAREPALPVRVAPGRETGLAPGPTG